MKMLRVLLRLLYGLFPKEVPNEPQNSRVIEICFLVITVTLLVTTVGLLYFAWLVANGL